MKTNVEAGFLESKFLDKVRKGLAYAMVGSMITIGAGAITAPRIQHIDNRRPDLAVLEEGPRSVVPANGPEPTELSDGVASLSPPLACYPQSSLEDLILVLKRSTVMIDTDEGLGSGVIIGHQGGDTVILTNRHVVEAEEPGTDKKPIAAATITVHNDGTEARAAKILLAPNGMDLALVIVHGDIGPAARMANTAIRRGTGVVAIGSPLGIEDSATRGIVSNFVTRKTDGGFQFTVIQTDAAINPGNSGGGLFLAESGELLGITTFKLKISPFETAEGMGFVIPINVLAQMPLQNWRELPMPAASHSSSQDAGTDAPVPSPH